MSNVNERFTNYDEFEFAQQRREAAKRKKEMLAKRAAQQGLQEPLVAKKTKKTALQKQMDANNRTPEQVDSINSIIEDLKTRFLLNGREVPGDESIKKMQQFIRNTDTYLAKKNMAGGAIFTDANKFGKNKDEFANVYNNVALIREPIRSIQYILKNNKKFDNQLLDDIRMYLLDLGRALNTAPDEIIHDEAVLRAIQARVPFWVGGSSEGGGHNVGFRDILRQLKKDNKNQTYQQMANRIEEFISNGKDPLSYVVESKKTTIKEAQLRQLIKESIMRVLNEDTTDETLMDRWDNLVEAIGAQEMCNALFKAMSHDQIEEMVEFLERIYEVGDTYGPNYDEEY